MRERPTRLETGQPVEQRGDDLGIGLHAVTPRKSCSRRGNEITWLTAPSAHPSYTVRMSDPKVQREEIKQRLEALRKMISEMTEVLDAAKLAEKELTAALERLSEAGE